MKHIFFQFIIFSLFLIPNIGSTKQNSSIIQIHFIVNEICNIQSIKNTPKVICQHNSLYQIQEIEKDQNLFLIYF